MAEAVEEQLENNTVLNASPSATVDRVGQKLTIADRTVTKLAFLIYKYGTPSGNVVYEIRKASDEGVLASKIQGLATDLPTVAAWKEVTFDSPVAINEEVYILFFNAGETGHDVRCRIQASDVKANEFCVHGKLGSWTDRTTWDCAYKYTYLLPAAGGQGGPAALVAAGVI